MQGMLNEHGELVVMRGPQWVNLMCPFADSEVPCAHHCPQMSEPLRQHNKKFNRTETVVHICHGRHWKFSDFEDRRQP
jgi:hypothetical protein